ncbi:MAG TPA: hypothetical protein PLK35_01400 [Candidatus Moranbacteria bacterium]|nr:hypothetical protein [Candidatus Moranbacteria bacterium]
MKRALLLVVCVVSVLAVFSPVFAGGGEQMTQNSQAQYIMGEWQGEQGTSRGDRTLNMVISGLQDDGKVNCTRYHLGPLSSRGPSGSIGPQDVSMKEAVLKNENGKLKLYLTPSSGKEIVFRLEGKKLVREPGLDGVSGSLTKK